MASKSWEPPWLAAGKKMGVPVLQLQGTEFFQQPI